MLFVCVHDSYMHNGKKLISHATRVNKQLYLNGGMVDLNVFTLLERGDVHVVITDLLRNFPCIDAVNHVDPQSVDHMVQLCAIDATEALRHLGGDKRSPSTTATAFWMEMTRRYLLVFQSRRWSLLERVRQAARIVVFLRVLRRHVQLADGLNLEANFLCNQTYTHVLLSLHTVSGFVARRGVVLLPAPPRVVVGGEAVWRRLGRVVAAWRQPRRRCCCRRR